MELRPPLLDQLGLAPALGSLGHRTGTAQVRVDPALSGLSLGPALRTDVYRVVEAALAAVSGKRRLVVSLDLAVREVNISVRPLDAETTVAELGTLEARSSCSAERSPRAAAGWSCVSQSSRGLGV